MSSAGAVSCVALLEVDDAQAIDIAQLRALATEDDAAIAVSRAALEDLGASLAPDYEIVQRWAERGMVWFSLGADTSFVAEGARALRARYDRLDAIKKRV